MAGQRDRQYRYRIWRDRIHHGRVRTGRSKSTRTRPAPWTALIFAASGLPEPHIPSFVYEEEEDTSFVHETRLIADFGDLPFDGAAMTLGVFYEDREHILNYPPSFAPGINAQFTGILNSILTGIVPRVPGAGAARPAGVRHGVPYLRR